MDVTVGVGVLGVLVLVRGGPGSGGPHGADGGGVSHGVLVTPGRGRLVIVLTHDVVGLVGAVAALARGVTHTCTGGPDRGHGLGLMPATLVVVDGRGPVPHGPVVRRGVRTGALVVGAPVVADRVLVEGLVTGVTPVTGLVTVGVDVRGGGPGAEVAALGDHVAAPQAGVVPAVHGGVVAARPPQQHEDRCADEQEQQRDHDPRGRRVVHVGPSVRRPTVGRDGVEHRVRCTG